MKLELISNVLCPFVHRAAIMLHEKGVAFDRRNVDLKNKPDWFLAISPRGKVPLLVADGTVLFESAAICEFLDETHPPHIVAEDPFRRAIERAWVEVANDLLMTQYKAFWTASATSSSAFSFRATSTTEEKSRANRMAVERPMPWLAPVTIATESLMRILPYCYVVQIGYERTD